MTRQDYTSLAYLARAVATEPERAPIFVAAARGDVQGVALGLGYSPDLQEAVSAIAAAFTQRKDAEQRELTLSDVVSIAQELERNEAEPVALAGDALRAAARELLLRRRRDLALTSEERDLVSTEFPPFSAG